MMKLFFRNILLFTLYLYLFLEILARIFYISTDAPKTYKNDRGNIKFHPNQEGYWNGGSHKWYINKLGYPGGNLPDSYDNLITIIGDSFIENFMNPDTCSQVVFLSENNPRYNYLEASRGGANLLEYFEIASELDTLRPVKNVMYVSTNDFVESISNISNNLNYLQVNLRNKKLSFPLYRGSNLKNILYNFKFAYYLYRKNLHLFQKGTAKNKKDLEVNLKKTSEGITKKISQEDLERISKFLEFIKSNYKTNSVVFVFHPNIDVEIYNLANKFGFITFKLRVPPNDNWQLKGDSHWSCYGHHQVAKQVSLFLDELSKKGELKKN